MNLEEDDNSNFKGLVSEISQDERKILLDKVRGDEASLDSSDESYFSDDERIEINDNSELTLSVKFKQESFFRRFLMWLIAAFSSTSVEAVYNKSLVSNLAHSLEKDYPGLIEFHKHTLYTIFYEKLSELHNVQTFFESYLSCYEKDPAAFYVTLGNVIMPELGDQIRKEADPYIYPFTKEPTKEAKSSLVRKMNEALDSVPPHKRKEMYEAIKACEWLKNFARLPVNRLVIKFTSSDEGKVCDFSLAQGEFEQLTRVLSVSYTVPDTLLSALYQAAEQQLGSGIHGDSSVGDSLNAFIESARNQISVLNMFVNTVPMAKLCKLVFSDAMYSVKYMGGGEDWGGKFKSEWRVLFDSRWENWIKDCEKERVKRLFNSYFDEPSLPLFPYRPWHRLWGGLNFRYELTLGFIYYFFKNIYPEASKTLTVISLEGEFSIKENRMELTDSLNELVHIKEDLDILANQLGAGGEFGLEFSRYENSSRTISATERIKTIMENLERSAAKILSSTGKVFRILENLLNGILSEKITTYYGPITNLSKIKGRENKKFREELDKCKLMVEHSFEVLKEIEPLDSPSVSVR